LHLVLDFTSYLFLVNEQSAAKMPMENTRDNPQQDELGCFVVGGLLRHLVHTCRGHENGNVVADDPGCVFR